jgi:hypothetical protein
MKNYGGDLGNKYFGCTVVALFIMTMTPLLKRHFQQLCGLFFSVIAYATGDRVWHGTLPR